MDLYSQQIQQKKKIYKINPKQSRKYQKEHIYIYIYISLITLNVSGINAPTKRYRVAEWIQKQDPYIFCL